VHPPDGDAWQYSEEIPDATAWCQSTGNGPQSMAKRGQIYFLL